MIYSFYERRVINMALLRIHRQELQLEQILPQLMQKSHPQGYEMEITKIYDSPIRICEEVLDEVKTNDNFETIEEIKQKYWPYQNCISVSYTHLWGIINIPCVYMKKMNSMI